MDPISRALLMGGESGPAQGQAAYTTPGTYSWVVPEGVTSISAVTVGGGMGGGYDRAGAGGGLAYVNNIAVTPGETLTVIVGAGGTRTVNAGFSAVQRSSTDLVRASGGGINPDTSQPVRGAPVVGTGGSGGPGYVSVLNRGGGGAGGYSGTGGAGGSATAGGSGGGGGGGGGASGGGTTSGSLYYTYASGGGGGVGILGQGTSGSGGTYSSTSGGNGGGGGSGGSSGGKGANGATGGGTGGLYGGGAGTSGVVEDSVDIITFGPDVNGGGGAVRIIWGPGRSFPSTNTGNV